MNFYRVFLHDEAPKLGSGWRVVYVERAGRKWVALRCPHTGATARVTAAAWAAIAPRAQPASPRAAVIGRGLRSYARSLGHKLSRAERAMLAAARRSPDGAPAKSGEARP